MAQESAVLPSAVFEWSQIKWEPTPMGERRRVFMSPTATTNEFSLHITVLNPGQAPHPPHKHPDEEMILIKEGTLEIVLNDKTQRAGPGSAVFVAPNDMHGWKNVGDTRATYFVLRWTTPLTASE